MKGLLVWVTFFVTIIMSGICEASLNHLHTDNEKYSANANTKYKGDQQLLVQISLSATDSQCKMVSSDLRWLFSDDENLKIKNVESLFRCKSLFELIEKIDIPYAIELKRYVALISMRMAIQEAISCMSRNEQDCLSKSYQMGGKNLPITHTPFNFAVSFFYSSQPKEDKINLCNLNEINDTYKIDFVCGVELINSIEALAYINQMECPFNRALVEYMNKSNINDQRFEDISRALVVAYMNKSKNKSNINDQRFEDIEDISMAISLSFAEMIYDKSIKCDDTAKAITGILAFLKGKMEIHTALLARDLKNNTASKKYSKMFKDFKYFVNFLAQNNLTVLLNAFETYFRDIYYHRALYLSCKSGKHSEALDIVNEYETIFKPHAHISVLRQTIKARIEFEKNRFSSFLLSERNRIAEELKKGSKKRWPSFIKDIQYSYNKLEIDLARVIKNIPGGEVNFRWESEQRKILSAFWRTVTKEVIDLYSQDYSPSDYILFLSSILEFIPHLDTNADSKELQKLMELSNELLRNDKIYIESEKNFATITNDHKSKICFLMDKICHIHKKDKKCQQSNYLKYAEIYSKKHEEDIKREAKQRVLEALNSCLQIQPKIPQFSNCLSGERAKKTPYTEGFSYCKAKIFGVLPDILKVTGGDSYAVTIENIERMNEECREIISNSLK